MSAEDIDAGARWNTEMAKKLEETTFGVICLTKSNQNAPWLMFEEGALAKTLDDKTRVVPYLVEKGMVPNDIDRGSPLLQFQAKRADDAGTFELIQTINKVTETPLTLGKLQE